MMKKTYKKTKKDYYNLKKLSAPVAKAVTKIVKDKIYAASEHKWYGAGFTPVSTFGSATGYNQQGMITMAQGIGDNQRTGDTITLRSIQCNVRMNAVAATVGAVQHIRVLVFQFKMNNSAGIAPTVTDMLVNDVSAGGLKTANSFFNVDFIRQYVILYDKVITVIQGTNKNVYNLKFRVPLKYARKKIQFNAAGTNSDGNIWIATIGSEPTLVANITTAAEYRVRFTDS